MSRGNWPIRTENLSPRRADTFSGNSESFSVFFLVSWLDFLRDQLGYLKYAIMQSSIPSARTSTSPRVNSHPVQGKRKRKTLSCYDCRRRKLKCDREEPSCSRCRKAGQPELCSYVYDVSSLSANSRPTNRQGSLPAPPSVSQQLDPSPRGLPSRHHISSPRVASQFLDISGKEYAPSALKAVQNQGTWQLLGQLSRSTNGTESRPVISGDIEDVAAGTQESIPKETVIFRGENFRTQYYGGSNATSSIAHVRLRFIGQSLYANSA